MEFSKIQISFPFDTERIIDDFVLFCMLIGNDFLPSMGPRIAVILATYETLKPVQDGVHAALPTLDINEGALDKILALYKQLLPAMGGYLTQAGQLNASRLELLVSKLADDELETLQQRAEVC